MNERIKKIRQIYKLTQAEFASRLAVSRDTIANLEYGRIDIKDIFIKSICSEFNVNENWLRTGEGEMFVELPAEDEYFKAATQLSNDPVTIAILLEYFKWDDATKAKFKESLKNIVKTIEEHEN